MIKLVKPFTEARFRLDGGAMFGIIPKPLWERKNPADLRNRIQLAARCWILDMDERRVLVESGIGTHWTNKERQIFSIEHPNNNINGALESISIDPGSITDVVLTHLHFDHAGGLTYVDESGDIQPTFPGARHHIQHEHWLWAKSPPIREAVSYHTEKLRTIFDSKEVNSSFHKGEVEIIPGLRVKVVHGHTQSMQLPLFEYKGRTIILAADLIPTSGHLGLVYGMGYDISPLDTINEKSALLQEAAEKGWIVGLGHDPDHAFIEIEKTGEKYHMRPVILD